MLIYLAGPIDAITAAEGRGWREEAAEDLAANGHIAYSPAHAFNAAGKRPTDGMDEDVANRVLRVHSDALNASHAVLANCEGSISHGTPLEMHQAITQGIPVFCWGMGQSIYRFRYFNFNTADQAMHSLLDWAADDEPDKLPEPVMRT